MKKVFLILIVLLGINITSNAQVCKISGENDSVEVFSADIVENGTKVQVTVANDSQNISASVTVNVTVTYKKNHVTQTRSYSGKTIAQPNTESVITIPIEASIGIFKPVSVEVDKISGTKCM